MFLLIRNKAGAESLKKVTLHSTMFLLIHEVPIEEHPQVSRFTFHNVSINTRPPDDGINQNFADFTVHNVSINTVFVAHVQHVGSALHSTMFLLILE